MFKLIGSALRVFNRIEDALLIAVLSVMITFATLQIVLRNLAGTGFIWGEALLQHLVLWLGLLGAMVATRERNHITIDITSQLLRGRLRAGILCLTNAFAAGICAILARSAVVFVMDEKSFGSLAFAKVPAWIAEVIIPVAFGVIALRFAAHAICAGRAVITGRGPEAEPPEPAPEAGESR